MHLHLELPFPPWPDASEEGRAAWRELALWQLRRQIGYPGTVIHPPASLDFRFARPQSAKIPGAQPDTPSSAWADLGILTELAPELETLLVDAGLLKGRAAIQALRLSWLGAPEEKPDLTLLATKDFRRHLAEWAR